MTNQPKSRSHLSHVENEGSEGLPLRGVHVCMGLVGDELVVHQRRPHALGPMAPAQHLQELLLEVLRILPRIRIRTKTTATAAATAWKLERRKSGVCGTVLNSHTKSA